MFDSKFEKLPESASEYLYRFGGPDYNTNENSACIKGIYLLALKQLQSEISQIENQLRSERSKDDHWNDALCYSRGRSCAYGTEEEYKEFSIWLDNFEKRAEKAINDRKELAIKIREQYKLEQMSIIEQLSEFVADKNNRELLYQNLDQSTRMFDVILKTISQIKHESSSYLTINAEIDSLKHNAPFIYSQINDLKMKLQEYPFTNISDAKEVLEACEQFEQKFVNDKENNSQPGEY